MRTTHRTIAMLALSACLLPPVLTGCGKESPAVGEKLSIPVYLAVGNISEGVQTKMTNQIVQYDTQQPFRGIQNFYVIPFSIDPQAYGVLPDVVQAGDESFSNNILLASKLDTYSFDGTEATKGYYSGASYVNNKTNTVLIYGEATQVSSSTLVYGSVAFKQRHGVIVPSGTVTSRSPGVKAEAFTFDLEPVLNTLDENAYGDWKTAHLAMLNAIAGTTSGTATFKDPATYEDDLTLSAAFRAFTGEGRVFSSADIPVLLTKLYRTCSGMPANAKVPAKNVATAIIAAIDSYTTATPPLLSRNGSGTDATISMTQPANTYFGLPEGTVVFQWGDLLVGSYVSGFGSPDKSEGINLASVQDYCYPPALWYYVNCPLLGCTTGSLAEQISNRAQYPTWTDIVNAKNGSTTIYTRGVTLDSKAAVVRDPLQYATGMLRLQLDGPATATEKLSDKNGQQISIEDENFPLTGIVLGGQRTQNFDFTAIDNKMRFVYDPDVNDEESGNPKAWLSCNRTSEPVYTLAFPTLDSEDIYFALEFLNDSGKDFAGARNCTILSGSKFYLIGKMEYGQALPTTGPMPSAVFVKDHITTLTVQFEALAGAYSILPELATPDLQLGVSATLTWNVATPSTVELQ